MNKKRVMVYFGHHKCASLYITSIIKDLCKVLGLKVAVAGLPADALPYNYHLKSPWKEKMQRIRIPDSCSNIDFMCYINASPKIVSLLEDIDYKGFHAIRDPRDMLISGYFSHKYSHPASKSLNPWIFEHRKRLLRVNFAKGLLLELDFFEHHFKRLHNWNFSSNKILETRFEAIIINPLQEFLNIFRFLEFRICKNNLQSELALSATVLIRKALKRASKTFPTYGNYSCSEHTLEKILERRSFKSVANRKIGEEDQQSHYRKGVPGDWKNYFTEEVTDKFKKRYGQLLINLNYEKDLNW